LETELEEILGDEAGRAMAVRTKRGEIIPCQLVGLTVGVSPNIAFLQNSGIATKRGILVNKFLQTNVADVYALGDCVERTYDLPGRKSVEQVWYTGRMMGEVVAQTICGTPTPYDPGPWFNSAKFFDIEYQTYGQVGATLGPDEEDLYWEHPSGSKAIHFVWNKNTREFLGINVFGIRLRHACFDDWLRRKKDIQFVLAHLPEANFDPEFFARHERDIGNALASRLATSALNT
jgi:NADPH-dependent 2,4-dienoyl-CoA reductase/sulfur reductase-like enzyme